MRIREFVVSMVKACRCKILATFVTQNMNFLASFFGLICLKIIRNLNA